MSPSPRVTPSFLSLDMESYSQHADCADFGCRDFSTGISQFSTNLTNLTRRITRRISRRTHLDLFHVSEVKDILHRCARDTELALKTPSDDCFRVPVPVETCSKSTAIVQFVPSNLPTIQRPWISKSRSSNISGAPKPKA